MKSDNGNTIGSEFYPEWETSVFKRSSGYPGRLFISYDHIRKYGPIQASKGILDVQPPARRVVDPQHEIKPNA